MVSIVVPAHNEARVIGRLLGQILSSADPDELDIVVVANGCTDDTAAVAASFGPPVRVVSVPAASKREALAEGNRAASGFPRLYVDADVELGSTDVRALGEALRRPGVLGAGPVVVHALADRPWPIRWYYDVWTRLPEVQHGLFGRGVVGVSEEGYQRIASLPPVLADDLAASLEFSPAERMIVQDAKVTVHPPRTFSDLLRGRARAVMGTTQLERADGAPASTARTRPADLVAIARREPGLAPRVALFLMVALLSRAKARQVTRKVGYSAWLRDASSRD
jgi:glycosyltransferase involved in cell wall biosynthesis